MSLPQVEDGSLFVCDLPFNLWNDMAFERIRKMCGGVIDVDCGTNSFGNLFETRLKVRGFDNGFLPTTIEDFPPLFG